MIAASALMDHMSRDRIARSKSARGGMPENPILYVREGAGVTGPVDSFEQPYSDANSTHTANPVADVLQFSWVFSRDKLARRGRRVNSLSSRPWGSSCA